MQKILLTIFLFLVLLLPAKAGQLLRNNISYEDGKYYISVEAILKAKKQDIFHILTDYDNLADINPKIIKSSAHKNDKGQTIVHTTIRDCILFICQNVINTQLMVIDNDIIRATTIAKKSNLKSGAMKWKITDKKDGVHIKYYAMFEPDFFIPPFIGPMILKDTLSDDVVLWMKKIENLMVNNNKNLT